MPYDEDEIKTLTPGMQRMMAQLVLAGWRFDKWMSGGVVVYCAAPRSYHRGGAGAELEEVDLSRLIMEAHLKRISMEGRPGQPKRLAGRIDHSSHCQPREERT